jgi:glucokinase
MAIEPARIVGAVDVGATKTLVAALPIPFERWPADVVVRRFLTPVDAHELVARIATALEQFRGGRFLHAVGVGAPGPLDSVTGTVLHSPNQAWRDIPLGPMLAAAVRAPVALDDDANLGALGEAILGAGGGASPVAYITIGTGIGAGIVINGRVVRGGHGNAGEVGHLVVDCNGPRCGCGGRGHVESFAGGAGLARRARAQWPSGHLRGDILIAAPTDADGIFRAARRGDLDARGLADEAADALGIALAALVATLDPDRIVVGGSLGLGQRSFVRAAVRRAGRRVMAEAASSLHVVPASLGPLSVLAGAAVLASQYERHP